jgi:AcrR family transcriptional regulator
VVSLTKEAIVEVALARADADGLASLSTRVLADELGVTPMALYRHVRNKDEIVDAVVDALLVRVGLPDVARSDWRAWLEELARSLRSLFLQQPVAIEGFTRQPVTTPAARARFAAGVGVLRDAGFGADDAVRAYAAVHTYTVGFCALEAARARGSSPIGDDPTRAEAAAIGQFVSEDQFGYGLWAVLAGLSPATGGSPR